jgi:hypothetical protein
VDQLRNDRNLLADQSVFVQFRQEVEDRLEFTESEVLLVVAHGAVVISDYNTNHSWQCSPVSLDGDAVYIIPWDEIRAVMDEDEVQMLDMARDADAKLLAAAHS